MISYIVKLLKYIISACLISVYCFILFNSAHINVPFEYKRFYLDRMLMDWPGINGLDYSLNTNLMFGLEYNDSLVKCRGEMDGITLKKIELGQKMMQSYI